MNGAGIARQRAPSSAFFGVQTMANPEKDLSKDDAKKKAADAIKANATKVSLEKQADNKWTLTITPAA
jgi:hypothetical protein